MNMKPSLVTIDLHPKEAEALALFVKRCHFGICERLSDPTRKDEPQEMMDAICAVQRSLAQQGHAPR